MRMTGKGAGEGDDAPINHFVVFASDISERLALQLNVINIFDKFYIDQLHFFHVVPGAGRTALLSLNFSY